MPDDISPAPDKIPDGDMDAKLVEDITREPQRNAARSRYWGLPESTIVPDDLHEAFVTQKSIEHAKRFRAAISQRDRWLRQRPPWKPFPKGGLPLEPFYDEETRLLMGIKHGVHEAGCLPPTSENPAWMIEDGCPLEHPTDDAL